MFRNFDFGRPYNVWNSFQDLGDPGAEKTLNKAHENGDNYQKLKKLAAECSQDRPKIHTEPRSSHGGAGFR